MKKIGKIWEKYNIKKYIVPPKIMLKILIVITTTLLEIERQQ